MVNIEIIKELREATGFSVSIIRKALEEARGDKARAIEVLKAHGATVAEKKAARVTGEGIVEAYVHANRKVGAMVILMCETDFVARNPMFIELAHELAMQVAAMAPKDLKELLVQPYIKDQDITIQELIQQYVARLGENIRLAAFDRHHL